MKRISEGGTSLIVDFGVLKSMLSRKEIIP